MVDPVPPRFFFIHVMKTAGTTFARQLPQQFPREAIYPSGGLDWTSPTDYEAYLNIPRLLALSAERRAAVQVYTGHFPVMVCDLIDPDLVRLTLLRDPIDRTLSVLNHFKRQSAYSHLSLEAIYENHHVFRFFVENHQTKVFSLGPDDDEPAINCGLTIDDARFARARDNLARVDVVGLTESYGAFVDDIRRRFGWWPNGVDLHDRANVSTEAWNVDAAFRRRIAAENAYDVELYQYAQRLVARRRTHSPP